LLDSGPSELYCCCRAFRLRCRAMAISKRAKGRFSIMSAAEKAAVKKAAKLLFDCELMGVKRMREIVRWAEKR